MGRLGVDASFASQIGYYHLAGLDRSVLQGTEFEFAGEVFVGAWERIKKGIEWAEKHGLGVLIGEFCTSSRSSSFVFVRRLILSSFYLLELLDLHAASGKQNPEEHRFVRLLLLSSSFPLPRFQRARRRIAQPSLPSLTVEPPTPLTSSTVPPLKPTKSLLSTPFEPLSERLTRSRTSLESSCSTNLSLILR